MTGYEALKQLSGGLDTYLREFIVSGDLDPAILDGVNVAPVNDKILSCNPSYPGNYCLFVMLNHEAPFLPKEYKGVPIHYEIAQPAFSGKRHQ